MSSSAIQSTSSTKYPGVRVISLARAPINALDTATWHALGKAFDEASDDTDVRAVVLASDNKKLFTAGLDLSDTSLLTMEAPDAARRALLFQQHIDELQRAVSAIAKCSKPVVAAIHGPCIGGGVDIACACDVRLASSSASFSIREVAIGLAADLGTLQRAQHVFNNDSRLRELALTGADFGAAEAHKLGFLSRVIEPQDAADKAGAQAVRSAALELAGTIAAQSPIAVLGTKHLLNYSRDHTIEDGLSYTKIWNGAMLQTQDLTTAFEAFVTKTKPTFAKLSKL